MKSPESEWRENAKPEDHYLRFYLELSAVHIWYAKVEVKSRLRRKAALAISGILKKKILIHLLSVFLSFVVLSIEKVPECPK